MTAPAKKTPAVTIDKATSAPEAPVTQTETNAASAAQPPVDQTNDDAQTTQGAAPRMVATVYGGPMVCLSTATVYSGVPREAVECGWLQDQIDAGTMYVAKTE